MKTISKHAISTAVLLGLASSLAYAQQSTPTPPAPTQQQANACTDAGDNAPDCNDNAGGWHHGKHGRDHGGRHEGGRHGGGRMMMLDTNNDGFINPDEAAAVAERAFMHIDKNRDGMIDQTEATTLPHRGGWRKWMGGNPPADVTEKLKAAFAERDTDKDGKVTKVEFMAYAQNRYATLDAAKDGKVSPWAFRASQRL
jgi:hypothetical protein